MLRSTSYRLHFKDDESLFQLACSWNNKLYYDGDHWKENGVDFYCTSSDQKARPGCYVENGRVQCTGALPGWYNVKSAVIIIVIIIIIISIIIIIIINLLLLYWIYRDF